MSFNNYRPDVAIVRDVGTLTHEQVQGLAAIRLLEDTNLGGLAPDHADLLVYVGACKDWNCVPAEVANNALALEIYDGFSEYDVVFSTVEKLIEALSPTKQDTHMDDVTANVTTNETTLNMPLAVLEPELTAEHIAVLERLGYEDKANSGTSWRSGSGTAFILTDNGGGCGEKAYALDAPANFIRAKAAFGYGTIFSTVDDLLAALQHTKH